jgi:DNA-binding LytR/AlgR family response regulator
MALPVFTRTANTRLFGEHTFIKTFEGETFFTTASLDELETRLDEQRFFRANRQTIVHRDACQSFSAAEYGKLKLQLHPEPKEPVIVSQKKAAAYRQWLQNSV